ncbi:MAG: alanine--glyoxylate aminotransferase family protein [Candidatus Omnitrophica bacterium]|nr:alanine--glyoxylate aminotransferase family protein [Candidatus Omnitrophota bacterium]
MKRNLLLTPGPSKVPVELCEVLGKPIIHHRTPQFQQVLKEVTEGLKTIMGTSSDVYLLASSGTGAMEAAVANIASPGDKVITVEYGKFGERWASLAKAYKLNAVTLKIEWGRTITPDEVKAVLAQHSDAKAIFLTQCETSTSATPDLQAIAAVTRSTQTALVVDAVSALGTEPIKMDEWGVDVVCSGSHKGLMLPPGVGIVAVSAKAIAMMEASSNVRFYFDLRKSRKALADIDTPFTPAIGIVIALNESVKMLLAAGLEKKQEYYLKMAKAVWAAAEAIGLKVYAQPAFRSRGLTAILVPEALNPKKLVKIMRDTHGITMAGGQGDLDGKIIRIAHMGAVDEYDLLTGLSCIEKVLKEAGHKFELGASLAAAQKVLNS